MKTKNILLALLCSLFLLPAIAQQKETPAKKKLRISLITEENGKKKTIEREFDSEEELQQFMAANKKDFAPAIPFGPLRYDDAVKYRGCKAPDTVCRKKVVVVDKEIKKIDGEESQNITIRYTDKDDKVLTEDIHKVLSDKDDAEEKIIIIRKSQTAKEEKEETVPGIISIEEKEMPSKISDLSFSPNPNGGIFHIRFNVSEPSDAVLQITDINGKEVYADEVKNFSGLYEKDIYRGDLSSGTYLMNVTAGGEKRTLKISVQK